MRKLIILKFGGSSVANPGKIKRVAKRVFEYRSKNFDVVVVVSALGDTTDELVSLAGEINLNPSEREMDMLLSTGEQISVSLLAMALHKLGSEAVSLTGAQVGIVTDKRHTNARILRIDCRRINRHLERGSIVIVAGFQGVTAQDEITTLGRGGSDLTAVALAKALNAQLCEIYTDVDGVFTADPRIVKDARKLKFINYDEMLEMASLGAQVLQVRSIEVAKKFHVPIHVRSSFKKKNGTFITRAFSDLRRLKIKEVGKMEDVLIRGITLNKTEAKITVCNVPDRPGVAARIFTHLSSADINVDMIVQNVSHTRQTDISFTVPKGALSKALKIARKVAGSIGASEVLSDEDIARVSIVGVGMKSHPGVAAKMFEALAKEKINIEMISTSEISICCIINKKFATRAVRTLHSKFKLNKSGSHKLLKR
ncbi:MAG: aspartate kinase [Candidatus Omnitrophica bacterium]|nr:aspartate kinase [Candidatus Omnitrophota bacterium]